MSNVLPPLEKQKLLRRMRKRYTFVGVMVLVGGALLASIALIPSLIAVRSAENALAAEIHELSPQAKDDQTKQTRAQALLLALGPIAQATTSPSTTLSSALGLRPAGVTVSSISYKKGEITLTGVAQNREGVSDYRDALQGIGIFKSVTVPVAALVGTQEGRFTMTLTGNF